MSDPIPILCTKFSTLDKTECSLFTNMDEIGRASMLVNAYLPALIAPSFDTSRNNLPTTPRQVGTIIVEVPSPARRNLTNFWDDDAQDNRYESDGEIGPFYDALEEEGEQYYDEDNTFLNGTMTKSMILKSLSYLIRL